MKLKRKLMSFVVAGIMAVMACSSLTSSAVEYDMDVNGDGNGNLADAVLIMQYLCGHHEPINLDKYDVDKNGVISPMDSYIIQCHSIGLL